MPIKFSKQHFAEQVEKLAARGTTYLDAIQAVCEQNDIDVEASKAYISGTLLEKVTIEARRLKLIRKEHNEDTTAELPI